MAANSGAITQPRWDEAAQEHSVCHYSYKLTHFVLFLFSSIPFTLLTHSLARSLTLTFSPLYINKEVVEVLVKYSHYKNIVCFFSSLPQGSTHSPGVARIHFCSVNDAIPKQFSASSEDAAPWTLAGSTQMKLRTAGSSSITCISVVSPEYHPFYAAKFKTKVTSVIFLLPVSPVESSWENHVLT